MNCGLINILEWCRIYILDITFAFKEYPEFWPVCVVNLEMSMSSCFPGSGWGLCKLK